MNDFEYDYYGFDEIPDTYVKRYNGNNKEVVIPGHVKGIAPEAFKGNSFITSVVINNDMSSVSFEAFAGCTELKKVVINGRLTEIGPRAFAECPKLEEVEIKSVKIMYDKAFYGCENLRTVNCHGAEIRLGKDVFDNCPKLKNMNFEDVSDKIIITYTDGRSEEFERFNQKTYRGNDNIRSVEINGFHDIKYDFFRGCKNLESVVIKGHVRIFGFAFAECPNLKKVVFYKTPSFHEYRISYFITAEESVFAGCQQLNKIEFNCSKKGIKGNLLSKRNIDVKSWEGEAFNQASRAQSDLNFWNGFHL